jgi:hypothetical protein
MGAAASLMDVEGSPELSAAIKAEYDRLVAEVSVSTHVLTKWYILSYKFPPVYILN